MLARTLESLYGLAGHDTTHVPQESPKPLHILNVALQPPHPMSPHQYDQLHTLVLAGRLLLQVRLPCACSAPVWHNLVGLPMKRQKHRYAAATYAVIAQCRSFGHVRHALDYLMMLQLGYGSQ